jgi:hypothetical protein
VPYCIGRPEGYVCSSAFSNDGAIGSDGDVFPVDVNGSFFLCGNLFMCGLCMVCGKKPLLMTVCFMADNS